MGTHNNITSFYRSGDIIRSRRVSNIVLSGKVEIPAPPARLQSDWQREMAKRLTLEPGDVDVMPLARARMRWPDYPACVQALVEWTTGNGLPDVVEESDIALMVCRGARFHHDANQYGGSAFCNLFLSEDKGLDVLFPGTGHRIPLARGTVMVFDTGQPHGVICRRGSDFDVSDFPSGEDRTQVFLTWELAIDHVHVARALNIEFDTAPAIAMRLDDEQVWMNGQPVVPCPRSGRWGNPDAYTTCTSDGDCPVSPSERVAHFLDETAQDT